MQKGKAPVMVAVEHRSHDVNASSKVCTVGDIAALQLQPELFSVQLRAECLGFG